MPLSPSDFLAAVITPLAAHLRGLDTLAVNAGCARCCLARPIIGAFLPHLLAQRIHEALPGPILAPPAEILVDGALGQQVVRQHTPLTARPIEIETRIENLSHVHFSRCTTMLGGRNQRLCCALYRNPCTNTRRNRFSN